jgi:hypothetical protein
VWRKSTDEGNVAAPPAEPRFDAAPPSPPPPGSASAQRRFNFLIVGLTVLLAAALVGGLLIFNRSHRKSAVGQAADPLKQVTDQYLAYSAAMSEELDQLTLAPVAPFLSEAGRTQEQAVLQGVVSTGYRYRVTTKHEQRVVVYAGQRLASVDDVSVRHTLPLDVATRAPAGDERSDTIHKSVAFKKEGDRWLVDSVVVFGAATPTPSFSLSYAASSGGVPLEGKLQMPIQQAYEAYWAANTTALRTLNVGPLRDVETDPLLKQDAALIETRRQKGQGYQIKVEHNFRVAQQDSDTFWVYDTFADTGYSFDFGSGKPMIPPPPEIVRESYEFRGVEGKWKIVSSVQYK